MTCFCELSGQRVWNLLNGTIDLDDNQDSCLEYDTQTRQSFWVPFGNDCWHQWQIGQNSDGWWTHVDERIYDATRTVEKYRGVTTDSGMAWSALPNGANSAEFIGSDHQQIAMTSYTIKDGNGNDLSVDSIDTTKCSTDGTLCLYQIGKAYHSEVGDIADVTHKIVISPYGECHFVKVVWLVDGTTGPTYVGQMAVQEANAELGHAGDSTIYTLTNQDDSKNGKLNSLFGSLWSVNHDYITSVKIGTWSSVNNYLNSTNKLYIEDKINTTSNKIYPDSGARAFSAGDIWNAKWKYNTHEYPNYENIL